MIWLERLLDDLPAGVLQKVTIQFPDPWFKKKHAKRRMVNDELVRSVADKLAPGGTMFVQTDIEFLADEMFDLFRANEDLDEIATDANPFPVKTEREVAVEEKALRVYRRTFAKKD